MKFLWKSDLHKEIFMLSEKRLQNYICRIIPFIYILWVYERMYTYGEKDVQVHAYVDT